MKKFLLALFIVLSGLATAQNKKTYSITPSHVLVDKATLNTKNDFKIYMENLTDDTLILNWQLISKEVVKGWDYSACAYGICYFEIPDSVCTMLPIIPNESGFISFIVDPKEYIGTAKLTYYLYDVKSPSAKDTITFIITAEDLNGIRTDVLANAWSMYPNPTSEKVSIKIDQPIAAGSSIAVINIVGQTVYQSSLNSSLTEISVNSLPAGVYFIRYNSGVGNFSAKKLTITR